MRNIRRHLSVGLVLVLIFSFQNCSQTQFEANVSDISSAAPTNVQPDIPPRITPMEPEGTVQEPSPSAKPRIVDIETSSQSGVVAVLYDDGTVWTWGDNYWGTLGYYSSEPQKKPKRMSGITNVKKLFGSDTSFFANKDDNTVWAWGYNSGNILGLGPSFANDTWVVNPQRVEVPITLIGAAGNYLLGADNALYVTGSMTWLYLGLGSGLRSVVFPEKVQGFENLKSLNYGWNGGGYALKQDGQVVTWGDASLLALGRPSEGRTLTPGVVPGLPKIIQMTAEGRPSSGFVLAVDENGDVWGWSDGEWGAYPLGGRNSKVPIKLDFINNVAFIAHSSASAFALKKDGTIWAWGVNSEGRLCLPSNNAAYLLPQKVALENVVKIVTTSNTSFFLTKEGKVYSCGYNARGTLGIDSDQIRSLVPVEVQFE